jgi:hypothetical protein
LVERFDAPGKMTLIVHPHAPWFWVAGAVLIFVSAVSALVFLAAVGSGAPMAVWMISTFVLVACAGGFLALWNKARTRTVFELLPDRLYVARVGPLARWQQVWVRETLKNIAVYRDQDRYEQNDLPEKWHYGIRICSKYRGRYYLHNVLPNREPEFLRGVVNELRMELGWSAQQPGDEKAVF